jgi:hypothetical protein
VCGLRQPDMPADLAILLSQGLRCIRGRRVWKLRLVRGLYERGYSREDIQQLFRFIDWLMELPEDLDEQFRQDVQQFEEEKQMP